MTLEAGWEEETGCWTCWTSFVEVRFVEVSEVMLPSLEASEAASGSEFDGQEVCWLCALGPAVTKKTHHIAAAVNLIH
jgi:hypothetical protein